MKISRFAVFLLRMAVSFALAWLLTAPMTAPRTASAQTAPSQPLGQAMPTAQFGMYSGKFLYDGLGLKKTLDRQAPALASGKPWSMGFWFRSSEPLTAPTLLAGLGTPSGPGARFLGLEANRLILWLGPGDRTTAGGPLSNAPWHYALATSDGHTITLYSDGAAVATAAQPDGAVSAPVLELAPDRLPAIDSQPGTQQGGPAAHRFAGEIAGLGLYAATLTASDAQLLASHPPDFSLIDFEEGSGPWPVQTRGMAGQLTPQDPNTLPRGKAPFQQPVAKPVDPAALHTVLAAAGEGNWTLVGGWRMEPAPQVTALGPAISQPGFDADKWYVATVPGTALTTLIDRGVYTDPDYGLNNLAIPESLAHQDYWYRASFEAPAAALGKHLKLTFHGINYRAEVWFNGAKLGTIQGAFLRGSFDVSKLAHPGANALAVRISPPPHPGIANEESVKGGPGENGGMQVLDGPTFSATEGWDWIPGIRDRDTGLWQDVTLTATGAVEIGDLDVITTLPKADNSEADLEIEAPLKNITQRSISAELTAGFDGVTVTRRVELAPGETLVRLEPSDYAALRVRNPRLWWPNGYGEPTLHTLTVRVTAGGQESAQKQIDFGMREVRYELSLFDSQGHLDRVQVAPALTHDAATPLIDETHQGIRRVADPAFADVPEGQLPDWKIQGWVQSLAPGALHSASVRPVPGGWGGNDLVLVVNGVRIAARGGNWGMDDSRKRVSLEHLEPYFRLHRDANVNMIRNWMGQNTEENFYALADKYGLMVWNDFWESTQDYNLEAEDPALLLGNARDTISRFRHHPSIVVWCGRNEGVPQPIVNEGLAELVRTLDHTRYYTGSSNRVNLRDSGPYQHQTPETYYTINRGFSVELGIPSVPTLESIQAWIPEADRWPIGDTWAYHDWHRQGNGDVKVFNQHLAAQYGEPTGLEDFVRKAEMLDYDGHRAIFEGFNAHLWEPNSGRMLWMTQPAWPSTMWQILSHDYDTQSSFYGVQKACEPVHAQLDLTDSHIDLINLGSAKAFRVSAKVVALDGKTTLLEQTQTVAAPTDGRASVGRLDLEKLAQGHAVLVQLKVANTAGKPVSDNFYWWAKQESSLRELNALPEGRITVVAAGSELMAGKDDPGEDQLVANIRNAGEAPVLAIKLTLVDAKGDRILPAYYSENYVSLLPGEERRITIRYPRGRASSMPPSLKIRAWNLPEQIVPQRIGTERMGMALPNQTGK